MSPVAIGSRTGCRSMTPGAMRSSAMNSLVAIGPLSSMGWPSEFTTRPDHGVAHRHAHDAPGALDFVAFADLGVFAEQHHAHLVFFQVHGDARPRRAGNWSSSPAMTLSRPCTRAMPSPSVMTVPDFVDGDLGFVVLDLLADQLRISSALICAIRNQLLAASS